MKSTIQNNGTVYITHNKETITVPITVQSEWLEKRFGLSSSVIGLQLPHGIEIDITPNSKDNRQLLIGQETVLVVAQPVRIEHSAESQSLVDIEFTLCVRAYATSYASLPVSRVKSGTSNGFNSVVWAIYLFGHDSAPDHTGSVGVSGVTSQGWEILVPSSSTTIELSKTHTLRWLYTTKNSTLYLNGNIIAQHPSKGLLKFENATLGELNIGGVWYVYGSGRYHSDLNGHVSIVKHYSLL